MPKVILKENGKAVEIEQHHREKFNYLNDYVIFLNNMINHLKDTENIDIEINLVEWGNLGSELLFDKRLDTEKIKGSFDSINNLSAIAIYYVGLNGYLLLEEYKEQRFCYIQLQQTSLINMIRIVYHEIQHFSDLFIPREWQTILDDGQSFIYHEKIIKAYNRLGLNEYYANLYAFSKSLILVNEILKNMINSSLIERFNKDLIDYIPSYLSNLTNELIEFLVKLESGEINNVLIQNPKTALISFLWTKFFLRIYYFLGGWKVYEREKFNTTHIQEAWDHFIKEIQEIDLNEMIKLLGSFKDLILEGFGDKDEVVNRIDLLFLNYYFKGLELDFSSFF